MKTVATQDIISKLLNNDETYIVSIYKTTFPKVLAFVSKNKGTFEETEEIFQDALFQIIVRAKVKGLEINSSFEAYLYTVCRNLWYKELNKRKNRVRNDSIFELKENDDTTIESILHQERWELFEEMLLKLSEKCKELLKDYFNKVSYKEILKKYAYATENAAFQRVFKCKKRLTELVKNDIRYQKLS